MKKTFMENICAAAIDSLESCGENTTGASLSFFFFFLFRLEVSPTLRTEYPTLLAA